ncbi:MAG: hypothetical protein H8F28_02650 [Fibrella sp.]|nr:hypothetical protein [Armatimonadota bacterium]
MTIDKDQSEPLISEARAAFTGFSDWRWNNAKNDYYDGFALWGEYLHADEHGDGTRFFVTFSLRNDGWTGDLTTGQPAFYWSDADIGDAMLVGTLPVGTLGDAIRVLKARMRTLFAALTGETGLPEPNP